MMSKYLFCGMSSALCRQFLQRLSVQQKAKQFRNYVAPPEHTLLHTYFQHVSQNVKITDPCPSNSLKTRDVQKIFKNLDCVFISPSKHITASKEYHKAMEQFRIILNEEPLEKGDIIKIIFYVGLQKKSKQSAALINLALKRLLNNIDQFTLTDTCILASAIYKCSVQKLNTPFLELFSRQLIDNLPYLMENPRKLTVLLKVLRQQRLHNMKLLHELTKASDVWSRKNLDRSHIMSYFAEAKFAFDEMHQVIETSIKEIEIDTRSKDIARILWAASTLGYKIPNNLLPTVWTAIKGKMEMEFLPNPDILLNCLLSMAVIGHYNEDFTAVVSSAPALSHYKKLGLNINWMRLYQLLDFREVECGLKSTYKGPPFPHPSLQKQLDRRPSLKEIHNFIKYLGSKLELNKTSLSFNVNSVNIAGITIEKNDGRVLHIEVLDRFVCLENSGLPVGLMACKLRLLDKMNSNYLIIDQKRIDKGEEELCAWIEDEMVRI